MINKYTEASYEELRKAIYLQEKAKREKNSDTDFDVRHMNNVKVADLSVSKMDKLVYNAIAAGLNKKLKPIIDTQKSIYRLLDNVLEDNRDIMKQIEVIQRKLLINENEQIKGGIDNENRCR